jgi:phenylpropionate dioxygenase-like ring-hydroxylating dioxygenase large terminal subunit
VNTAARGLEPRFYTDDEVFALERERVFAGSWIPVCRIEDLARPGDYVTYDLAGDPIVVTRTRDGRLAAMANVCRHRNMVIVTGSGNASALQCPYHLWTYSLDGTLVGAPQTAGLDGFDRGDYCLPRLAVDTWQGFVLANTDPDAAPLGPQIAGLDGVVEGLGMEEMVRVESITWDQPWNWKVTFENYAESYHHPGVHPDSLQPVFPGEKSMPRTGDGEPWMCLEHVSTVDGVEPFTVFGIYPLLWPTVVPPDVMTWLKIEVHSARHASLATEVFVHESRAGDQEHIAAHVDAVRAINTEDIVPNSGVFTGLRSRYAVTPTLHPLEAALEHFTGWYLDRMEGRRARS